jgi:hypothetical protein
VPPRTTQQAEAPEQLEEENEVTRASDLGFNIPEVSVQPIAVEQLQPDDDGYVVIRMAETIDEFTYGNQLGHVELKAGKMYRVPGHIARYLQSLGKVYNR